jgi:hypothetical protein
MPTRAQAVGSRASPHLALGRSRDRGSTGWHRRRRAWRSRTVRRVSRERYRVYAEDEFFAAVAREHDSSLEPSPSCIAPRRHRVAGVAVLVGVLGAVAGVVALDVLSQRGGARRKAAPRRVARTDIGAATVAALRMGQLRRAQAGRARSSAGRERIFSAPRPRQPKARRRLHDGSVRAVVDRTYATAVSTPDGGDPHGGHAVVMRLEDATTARPVDEQVDRIVVAKSDNDLPRRSRVEFGFER